MISLFESGEWQIKRQLCNCINCFVGQFSDSVADNAMEVTEISDKILSLDETNNTPNDIYLFVENDSFVGVYSAIKLLELFYIVRIIEKCVAVEDICDIYGHHVQCGANYLKGYYLEKSKGTKYSISS